ncbi:MAG: M20 family metallopeptidase [Trueperaceae bacterium]
MNLRELARAERDTYLKTLKDLVTLESPTHDKAANDNVADYLEDVLKADAWAVERLSQNVVGDQLVARRDATGDTSTLLLCHFDTVWDIGTLKQMPLREEADKLYGPGVLDMKAGITTAIHAMRLSKKHGLALKGPVTLLLTSDEETSSEHSQQLIESQAKRHDRVLVLEPSRDDGALKVGRKGIGGFEVTFKGKSAHAGNNPKDGASALRELANFLFEAEKLTDDDQGTTVNLTVAKGGTVSNVIAEEAHASLDLRVLKLSEAERVEKALRVYKVKDLRVTVSMTGGMNRPPLEFDKKNQALFEEAKVAMKSLGLTLEGSIVGGGSDGNFTSAIGLPTLDGLGSAGEGPHARHEHIRISETLDRLALLVALLTRA